jgi:hypothetical protein
MLTRADVDKLAAVHVVQQAVLSLYLTVPPLPAELGGLLVRAGELMAAAGTDSRRVRDEDVRHGEQEPLVIGGGQISVIHGGPPQIVAKLCFPMG